MKLSHSWADDGMSNTPRTHRPGLAPVRSWIAALTLAGLAVLAAGCEQVKPWQRGGLADPIMQPDRDPVGTSLAGHVFFSREAATGGRGVGGGGCGCN